MDEQTKDLVAQWRAGSEQAARALYDRYFNQLVAMVRRRLSSNLSQRVDPEDVIQSVYCCFFADSRAGRYDLNRGGDLWHLLVTMSLHKLNDKVKWHTSMRRAVTREQPAGQEEYLPSLIEHVSSREPSPEEAVSLNDLLERVMRELEPLPRRVLQLRLQGYNLEEIAAHNGCSQRTVIRILERIKKRLEDCPSE